MTTNETPREERTGTEPSEGGGETVWVVDTHRDGLGAYHRDRDCQAIRQAVADPTPVRLVNVGGREPCGNCAVEHPTWAVHPGGPQRSYAARLASDADFRQRVRDAVEAHATNRRTGSDA